MTRVAFRQQADLFTRAMPPQPPPPSAPAPAEALRDLLERLRSCERLPWADAAATMAEERRAVGLARLAGPEGEVLLSAILDETERLLAIADRESH